MLSYLYLLGSIYFFAWWVFVFLWRKECRKEVIFISVLAMIAGPFVQVMHLKDWWHPIFISDFPLKIEDLIFGFSIGGVSAVIYQEFKNLKERRYKKLIPPLSYEIMFLILAIFLLFGLFYWFGISSFWTSIFACLALFLMIMIKRPDLFHSMVMSSAILPLIAIPFYLFGMKVNPTWIQNEWYLDKLSGLDFLGIPLEELLWYFFIGLAFSALWEFIRGLRFIEGKPRS